MVSNIDPPKSIPVLESCRNTSIWPCTIPTMVSIAPPSKPPTNGIVCASPDMCFEKSVNLFPPTNSSLPRLAAVLATLPIAPMAIPMTPLAAFPTILRPLPATLAAFPNAVVDLVVVVCALLAAFCPTVPAFWALLYSALAPAPAPPEPPPRDFTSSCSVASEAAFDVTPSIPPP